MGSEQGLSGVSDSRQSDESRNAAAGGGITSPGGLSGAGQQCSKGQAFLQEFLDGFTASMKGS
jgi:hypothetical protein